MPEISKNSETEIRQDISMKRILIVDDEAVIRDLCIRALKGYHIVQAGNGQEASRIVAMSFCEPRS